VVTFVAFDTSTTVGSVAVGWGTEVLAARDLPGEERHAATLLPTVAELLREAGMELSGLRGIGVGSGPGSFTGVRVAAATALGLARGLEIPLYPVSSLAAAAAAGPDGEPLWVLFDARGDRVYAAAYRVTSRGVQVLAAPVATRIPHLLQGPLRGGGSVAGEGALRHRESLEEAGCRILGPPAGIPRASGILRLLGIPGAVSPVKPGGAWEPEYLKGSSAMIPGGL